MIRFFIGRILMFIPIIIAVSLIVFILLDIAPGDRLSGMALEGLNQEEIQQLRASLGIDDPLLVRYGRYMFGLLQGNLGKSELSGLDVFTTFMERLPNTLALAGLSIGIAVVVSIPLGVFAARHSGRIADNITTAATMFGMATPTFWMGIIFILLFSSYLKWLPSGGYNHGFLSLILPALATSSNLLASSTRQTRSSMLEVLNADYLRTARAKGVPEGTVIRKHALRNALVPIVTTVGMSIAFAVSGTAVTETVFAFPGTGRLMVQAVNGRDLTTILGTTIMTTFVFTIVVLLVDVAYTLVDPRIKASFANRGWLKNFGRRKSSSNAVPKRQIIPLSPEKRQLAEDRRVQQIPEKSITDNNRTSAEAAVKQRIVSDKTTDTDVVDRVITTKKYKKEKQIFAVLRHLSRNPGAVAGVTMLAIMVIFFIVSFFMDFSLVSKGIVRDRFLPPSSTYPFGTDNMGRNAFLRVIYATRFSLPIGIFSTSFGAVIGITFGSLAAYYGGIFDTVAMRIADTITAIPSLLLSMVIVTVLGRSLPNLMIAIGFGTIPGFMRMSRASILTVKGNEYVEAGRAMGLSTVRIIFGHVLPNGMAPLIISVTNSMGMSILMSAGLSFLGLGVPVPNPEWGSLVSDGRNFITNAPWLTIFPGIFIIITVMGFCMLGDGLRDALDPKLKNVRLRARKS